MKVLKVRSSHSSFGSSVARENFKEKGCRLKSFSKLKGIFFYFCSQDASLSFPKKNGGRVVGTEKYFFSQIRWLLVVGT